MPANSTNTAMQGSAQSYTQTPRTTSASTSSSSMLGSYIYDTTSFSDRLVKAQYRGASGTSSSSFSTASYSSSSGGTTGSTNKYGYPTQLGL